MSPSNVPQSADGSDRNFWRLLDMLPAGAYTCDADGLITYFNRQAVEVWGRAPSLNDPVDRFCGSFKLFATDGTPLRHDQCWMALALRERRGFNGQEIIIERPDGSRISGLAHANPLFDDAGQLIGAVNVLVDVTDLKRAEEIQAQLAAIVQSSDDAIISKTLEGRILSWNPGAERLFGYSAWEAIGQHITLIIPPERRHEEEQIIARLARGERIEHYETVRVAKGGQRIHISLSISPLKDRHGRIYGASKVGRDITARKEAEERFQSLTDQYAAQLADLRRLHAMSVRLATTLELEPILDETLRTAVAIDGADMGVLSLCDAEHEYLELGASVGFNAELLPLIQQTPIGVGACGACFLEQRRVIVEDVESDPLLALYRDLARRAGFRAVHSTPLITRSGKVVGVLSTHFRQPHRPTDREMHLIDLCARQAVDFIENAQLYEQLREADRRKDEFLATLAHELRNPLAPISNSLQILSLADDLSTPVAHVRDIMKRQVNHMVRLVDDLLEVSRITRGKIELRKEPVDLMAVVGSAVETSRPVIEAAGHQLAISVSPEAMVLEADPVRLAQVVSNLLNNAAKYTERGGQIWLAVRREGSDAVLSVRDNGVGIPADMLPRVFEMFMQVDGARKRAQGGLGIGLTLARSLVQMHEGSIEAHSDGPGRGSEFVVRLPLLIGATAVASPPAPSAQHAPVLPRRRILLVDDTPAAVATMAALLETLGQQVHTAEDGATALELARRTKPELVISDIGMPRMNGYELARRLRQEPGLKYVPLVALTGYGQDGDRQESLDAGFDFHLVKPVSLEALSDLLGTLPVPPDPVLTPLPDAS